MHQHGFHLVVGRMTDGYCLRLVKSCLLKQELIAYATRRLFQRKPVQFSKCIYVLPLYYAGCSL